MKIQRFILLFGFTSVLLAACASAPTPGPTQPVLPTKGSSSSPSGGPVLTWQRSGGIAGFCDSVRIFASGAYTAENCSAKPPTRNAQLDEAQLKKLTDWVNSLQSFSNGEDPAAPTYPDQMYVKTTFVGTGSTKASIEQMVEISNFVSGLALPRSTTPEAANKARQFLAAELKISEDEIGITSVEAVEWPDACMGIVSEMMCAQVITPGYLVILDAQGKSYELHTSIDGANMQMVKP